MKKLLVAVSIVLGASSAFASVQDNFVTCSQDSQWYNNFGRYVVAFSMNAARAACSQDGGDYRAARCKINGSWVNAGYYCVDVSGPS